MSFYIFKTSHRNTYIKHNLVLCIVSFIMSIFWIDVVSNVLIDVVYFIVFVTGMHYSFIGLSLLAWGNSVGTYYANSTLAKCDYGVTSITGCFAEPIFNIVIGFGFSLIKRALKDETSFIIFNDNNDKWINIVLLGTLYANLIFLFFYLIASQWNFKKVIAKYSYVFYFIFLIIMIILNT